MPYKIRDIKGFVPRQEIRQGSEDVSKNNVLYNLSLLAKELEGQRLPLLVQLRTNIGKVIDAVDNKIKEADGDRALQDVEIGLNTLKNYTGILRIDDEKRKKIDELVQYSTAGLGIYDPDIPNYVMEDVEEVRENGRKAVGMQPVVQPELQPQPQPQPEAEPEIVGTRTYLTQIDEYKRQVGLLPRIGRDGSVSKATKDKEIDLCLSIMAARRAGGAKRNQPALIDKPVDPDSCDKMKEYLSGSDTLKAYLSGLTSEQRRALAGDGHGGKLEEAFKKHVRHLDVIPSDIPNNYMPDAKRRCEILQDKMKSAEFAASGPMQKTTLYTELIATRAAVHSIRGEKASLTTAIDPKELSRKRKLLQAEPMKSAIFRAADKGRETIDHARQGHGGAFEDDVREIVRDMGCEEQYGYRVPSTHSRWAPTYGQRISDIYAMVISKGRTVRDPDGRQISANLNEKQIAEKYAELYVIGEEERVGRYADNYKLQNMESYNRKTDIYARGLKKALAKDKDHSQLEKAMTHSPDGLLSVVVRFVEKNKGTVAAYAAQADIEKKADEVMNGKYEAYKTPEQRRKALVILAAQKLVVDTKIAKTQNEKNLYQAVLSGNINSAAQNMLKNDVFDRMTKGLNNEQLVDLVKNPDLIDTYVNTMRAGEAEKAGNIGKEAGNVININEVDNDIEDPNINNQPQP
ncbi:MAG: hypothetical protein IKN24_01660 [Lachnospiraceae bacterium]|nr:hypothetical protein [Lachnospiraceae bacterium]